MQKTLRQIKWYDDLLSLFYRIASDGWLPAKWFSRLPPKKVDLRSSSDPMKLEIVAHCWNYASSLAYQLSSLVNYPPSKLNVIYTLYYSLEDEDTQAMVEYFSKLKVSNVIWNFQAIPTAHLLRRCIGRNQSAINTNADWVWFTDCDIIFAKNCLDSLADRCRDLKETLVFPLHEYTTPMLQQDDPMFLQGAEPQVVSIDEGNFTKQTRDKAKGAFQIVHGDVARTVGYCNDVNFFHTPQETWRKTYEDKVFRWILGTRGTPIDIPGVFQIRHVHKGRYTENSAVSKVRSKIRHMQE